MKFLRKNDKNCYTLCSIQARVFQRSSEKNCPSYYFVQAFMMSNDAKEMDNLGYLYGGSSEIQVFISTMKKVPVDKKAAIYDPSEMHWFGFFYRAACYLTGIKSKEIFKKVSLKYLHTVYPAYHGLDIVKAVERVFEDLEIKESTPEDIFKSLFVQRIL